MAYEYGLVMHDAQGTISQGSRDQAYHGNHMIWYMVYHWAYHEWYTERYGGDTIQDIGNGMLEKVI